MKMLVRDSNNQYLKIEDIDVVFTANKEEASDFSKMDAEDFSKLKNYIESNCNTELETIFE